MGGMIVSLFASLGDVLKPKSFAGLFGAAPSVALATLGLTVLADGKGVCRSRGPIHGRRSCILLCILGTLYLANAAQKGQPCAGDNRESYGVAGSRIGNLGGIPAAIEK